MDKDKKAYIDAILSLLEVSDVNKLRFILRFVSRYLR